MFARQLQEQQDQGNKFICKLLCPATLFSFFPRQHSTKWHLTRVRTTQICQKYFESYERWICVCHVSLGIKSHDSNSYSNKCPSNWIEYGLIFLLENDKLVFLSIALLLAWGRDDMRLYWQHWIWCQLFVNSKQMWDSILYCHTAPETASNGIKWSRSES